MRKICAGILSTESKSDFEAFRSSLEQDIKPRNAIERMYCDEFVVASWESMRWRRYGAAIQSLALGCALYEVLVNRLAEYERGQETSAYLDEWFTNDKVKREVAERLRQYNLDTSAIEAEAFRKCSTELMTIDQLLVSAETRRDKALRNLAFYRGALTEQLQPKVVSIAQNDVRRIELKPRAAR